MSSADWTSTTGAPVDGRTIGTWEGLVIGPSIGGVTTLRAVGADVLDGPTMMIPGLAVGVGSAYGSIGRMFPDGPAYGLTAAPAIGVLDRAAYGSNGNRRPGAAIIERGAVACAFVELDAGDGSGFELDDAGPFTDERDASHGAMTQRIAA